ncbi:hypothetical protein MOQ72_16115 [Saccharopolyspora sp. K220]|uniref:hypothetical protein n=1 Tax=Saccharopolyspora soli TaxID=2926618 RepID=UPI001F588900|nr:hypothetical protein [Saccharopolyspora soli]MCI2418970.1 hypothetical protein [Saccharopolyspora soli]
MEFSHEYAEMLPEREALNWWGGFGGFGSDIAAVNASNTAVALGGGPFSTTTAVALQNINVNQGW